MATGQAASNWRRCDKRQEAHAAATTDRISMLQILSLQLNAFKCIFLLPQPSQEGEGRRRQGMALPQKFVMLFSICSCCCRWPCGRVSANNNRRAERVHTLRMRNATRHAINSTIKGHQLKRASARQGSAQAQADRHTHSHTLTRTRLLCPLTASTHEYSFAIYVNAPHTLLIMCRVLIMN